MECMDQKTTDDVQPCGITRGRPGTASARLSEDAGAPSFRKQIITDSETKISTRRDHHVNCLRLESN